jgi:hypothetical protein
VAHHGGRAGCPCGRLSWWTRAEVDLKKKTILYVFFKETTSAATAGDLIVNSTFNTVRGLQRGLEGVKVKRSLPTL